MQQRIHALLLDCDLLVEVGAVAAAVVARVAFGLVDHQFAFCVVKLVADGLGKGGGGVFGEVRGAGGGAVGLPALGWGPGGRRGGLAALGWGVAGGGDGGGGYEVGECFIGAPV